MVTFKVNIRNTIENHFRQLVLEGNHDKAVVDIMKSFPDLEYNHAVKILSGEMSVDSNDNLIEEVDEKYKEKLKSTQVGVFFYKNYWYKPYLKIINYGLEDKKFADTLSGKITYYDKYGDSKDRALFYAYDKIRDRVFTYNSDVKFRLNGNYICERVNAPFFPIANTIKTFYQAVEEMDYIEESGYSKVFPLSEKEELVLIKPLSIIEVDSSIDELKAIKESIIKSAELNGGFFEIEYEGNMYNIPVAPFEDWVLSKIDRLDKSKYNWKPVSPYCYKCYGDNRYHSDWVLGGLISEDIIYKDDFQSLFWDRIQEIESRVLGFKALVLQGSGYVSGYIGKGILLIPDLSMNYYEEAVKSSAIITECGGKMAHLVQVLNIPIVRVNDINEFYRGDLIQIDCDKGILRVVK